MTSNGCLELWPGPECGVYGSCVNGTICVCEEGWSQSREFSFFVEENELQKSLCNFNGSIIYAIYAVTIVMATVTFFLSMFVFSRSKERLKRGLLPLLGLFLTIVFSLYRVINPDALFGYDIVFGFFFGNALMLLSNLSVKYFQRYLLYLTTKYGNELDIVGNSSAKKKALTKYVLQLQPFVFTLDIIVFQGFWIIALLDRNSDKVLLLRVILGWISLRYVYIFGLIYLMNQVIKDMKFFIGISKPTHSVSLNAVGRDRFVDAISRQLPKTIRFHRSMILYMLLSVPQHVIPLFNDWWLQNWVYFLPAVFPMFLCLVLASLVSSILKECRRRKKTTNDILSASNSSLNRKDIYDSTSE